MENYEVYRTGFLSVLELAELSRFKEIECREQLFYDLSSISNTEMYVFEFRDRIERIQTHKLVNLLIALSNLANKYYRNREEDWYFVNTFSQIRQIVFYKLDVAKQNELIDYFLRNRKNERMPFAKDLPLSIDNIKKYFDYMQQENKRIENHNKRVLTEQLLSQEKKNERQAHTANSEIKQSEREKYLDWFSNLTDKEKLQEILKNEKPINYYGNNYDCLKISVINELEIDDVMKLIEIIKKSNVKALKTLLNQLETMKNHR